MTHNNTLRYIDVLEQLVDSYNNTEHSSISMSPNEVNRQNREELWQKMYGNKKSSLNSNFMLTMKLEFPRANMCSAKDIHQIGVRKFLE